jgi:hypothetical protein
MKAYAYMFYSYNDCMRLITNTRIALIISIGLLAPFARAQSQMELKGSVPINCTLNISPSAKANSLNVLSGENNSLVATLTETCNAGNGYLVQIVSSNKGRLINSAAPAIGVADYQVHYDNAQGAIATSLVANRSQAQFARLGNLTISFFANGQRPAGTYSDTLKIVISAK